MTDVYGSEINLLDERNSVLELPTSLSSLNLNDLYNDIEEVIDEMDRPNNPKNKSSSNKMVNWTSNSCTARDGGGGGGGGRAAHVKILIQPAQKAHRFRYECEGRLAGCILGANSTPENKTYPTIQVVNSTGKAAVVVVSCVTRDQPYRPHPHKLVGKEGCKRGICTVQFTNESMICSFSNLGIQCVKRKDIEEALKEREEIQVDPFKTGFAHKHNAGSIDLNCVRLCFQVFLEGAEANKFTVPLPPVVSDPIHDKKAMFDLVICKLSACSASVLGGTEIILLCEKIVRDDIQVRFYELRDDQMVWEELGEFQPTDVHKQVAISLKTPKYQDVRVQQPVEVYIQLRRPSDGATSEPRNFQLLPETDYVPKRKIPTINYHLNENTGSPNRGGGMLVDHVMMAPPPPHHNMHNMADDSPAHRLFKAAKPKIKQEPPDRDGMMSSHYSKQPPNIPVYSFPVEASPHNQPPPPPHPFFPYFRNPSPYGDHAPNAAAAAFCNLPPVSSAYLMGQQEALQGLTNMNVASPEVVNLPSYGSSRSNAAASTAEHHSGESALSFGLGSGPLSFSDSLLSGISLSHIGSQLSDTFLCLNSPENEVAGLHLSGADYASVNRDVYAAASEAAPPPLPSQQQQARGSREQSLDSFSRIQNLQDQIRELNQLGGDIAMSDSLNMDKNNQLQ